MVEESQHRIRIVRDGLELEVEGERSFIEDMLDRFWDVTISATDELSLGPSARVSSKDKNSRELSANEFIRRLGFTKHTDRALAFGYFLESNRGQDSFTTSDVNSLYYEAKMEPTNTSAAFAQLVKRGHIMEAKGTPRAKGTAKVYTLTQSGVGFIEEALAAQQG